MAFSDCSDVSIIEYEECGTGFGGGGSGGGSTTGGGGGGGGTGTGGGGTVYIPDPILPSFLHGFYNIPLNLWSTQHVVMPPGYDLDLVEKLMEISAAIGGFSKEQFEYFQSHPDAVVPLYQFIGPGAVSTGEGTLFAELLQLAVKLKLTGTQITWFTDHTSEIAKATSFAASHNYDANASLAVRLMVDLKAANAFPINISAPAYQAIISQYAGELGLQGTTGPGETWAMAFGMEFAILKYHDIQDHPNPNDRSSDIWLGAQAAWKVSSEAIHIGLDVIGLAPVIGEAADVTNATIYVFQGNWQDASLSVAGIVPFAGWFSTIPRLGKRLITHTGGLTTLIFKNDNGAVVFYNSVSSCRTQLRKVLGTPANWVAHHIMPLEHDTKAIVQRAAKAADDIPFHVNQPGNGKSIYNALHSGSHSNYNAQMGDRLDELWNLYGNQTTEVARDELNKYLDKVRQVIVTNFNTNINALVLPPVQ